MIFEATKAIILKSNKVKNSIAHIFFVQKLFNTYENYILITYIKFQLLMLMQEKNINLVKSEI